MPGETQELEPGKVLAFARNIDHVPQQRKARLVKACDANLNYQEKGAAYTDNRFGLSEPEEVFVDDAPTPSGKIDQFERRGTFRMFHDGKTVGTKDQAEKLVEIKNPTVQAMGYGKERLRDRIILGTPGEVGGIFGDTIEIDQEGNEDRVTFPSARIIAVNENQFYGGRADGDSAPTAFTGLSPQKLRKGRLLLADGKYANMTGEQPCIAVEREDLEFFMTSEEVRNVDYNGFTKNDFARLEEVSDDLEFYWKGFNWKVLPNGSLPIASSSTEFYVPIWYPSAIGYKERVLVSTKIWNETSKSFTWQCFYKSQHSSIRREDEAVAWIRVQRPS